MGSDGIAVRETARPAAAGAVDVQADVVVVGGGGGGLPAALFSRWLGDEVVLLEKAPELGGTARRPPSGTGCRTTSRCARSASRTPRRTSCATCARLSRPESYDPDSPTLGLSAWELDLFRAIYESASPGRGAAGRARRAALPPLRGRPGLLGRAARGQGADRPRPRAGRRPRVDVRRRASRHPHDERRRRARRRRRPDRPPRPARHHRRRRGRRRRGDTADGRRCASARARPSSSRPAASPTTWSCGANFLSAPVYGGCAAVTNEGDFVRIAGPLGAQLRNMNYAWMCPIPLEKAPSRATPTSSACSPSPATPCSSSTRPGAASSTRSCSTTSSPRRSSAGTRPPASTRTWSSSRSGTSAASATRASDEYGRLIVGDTGASDAHVIRGETLEELADAIRARFERVAYATGGAATSEDFLANLQAASRASTSSPHAASTRTSAAASAPCSSSSTAT